MKIANVVQGTPPWYEHRAKYWNASDAAAMLGIKGAYKTRRELLDERKRGFSADVDASTQHRFDEGHRFEALARPLAENIISDELFPCVGSKGDLSASFDGLTMDANAAFEHKTLNDDLRAVFEAIEACCGDGEMLPEQYRVQMEQQLAVSGAGACLFMASEWNADDTLKAEYHTWYHADLDLRARIIAGWQQFAKDLETHEVTPSAAPAPIGRKPETMPALVIQAKGMVTASNLAEYKAHAMAVLGSINRKLVTDEDFADADKTVKWCSEVEDRLAATKANVLGQMADVDAVCRAIDDISAETRRIRLELDKLVKAEKESRKAELVQAGATAVRVHYDAINATLGDYRIQPPQSLILDIGSAIKGLKTLVSMRDKIDAAAANAKIQASQKAETIRACIAILDSFAMHADLFPDRVTLCHSKAPDDLRNLASSRAAEYERQHAAKLEAERERIRAEEVTRIDRERHEQELKAAGAPAAQQPLHESANMTGVATGSRKDSASESVTRGSLPPSFSRLKLGDINAAIAPLSITAEGLAQLGFHPVATERAAKLYSANELPRMLRMMVDRLQATDRRLAA